MRRNLGKFEKGADTAQPSENKVSLESCKQQLLALGATKDGSYVFHHKNHPTYTMTIVISNRGLELLTNLHSAYKDTHYLLTLDDQVLKIENSKAVDSNNENHFLFRALFRTLIEDYQLQTVTAKNVTQVLRIKVN